MIVSVFSVVRADPTELSNDSSNSVYVLTAAVDVSIITIAEDAPFAMVTNGSEEALFCRNSIVCAVCRVIVGVAFSTVSYAEFPLRITIELAIDWERLYSYT